jgi:hypothetical protein
MAGAGKIPDELGINSLSDWAAWIKKNPGKMTVATNAEFYSRADGFKGMMEFYGLSFGKDIPDANVKKMETPLCKKAVRDKQAMCGMAFATDGEINAYNQKVLADDKGFFPIYNPAPVIRKSVGRDRTVPGYRNHDSAQLQSKRQWREAGISCQELAKRRGPYCQEEEIDEYTRIFCLSGADVALMQKGVVVCAFLF